MVSEAMSCTGFTKTFVPPGLLYLLVRRVYVFFFRHGVERWQMVCQGNVRGTDSPGKIT